MSKNTPVWSYEASVHRASKLYARWKDVTAEFLEEIYDARQHIESSPHTWEEYCREIGVSRQTIVNWLKRYDPETKSILPPPPEDEPEVEVFTEDEKPEPKKEPAKPKPKQNNALDYWSQFSVLMANCKSVAAKMEKSMDENTPLALAYAVGNIKEFASFLDSWRPENMHECDNCHGEGCEFCFNGKRGDFRA